MLEKHTLQDINVSNNIDPVLTDIVIDQNQQIITDNDCFNDLTSIIDNHKCQIRLLYQAIIDSTGIPDSINMPITCINNHNGLIGNEIRLIFVLDRNTGLPIYFRYVQGNIVDVSTLKAILIGLKCYNININQAIIDAGYYSDSNIKELYSLNIPFVIRLSPNRKIFKNLLENHLDGLESAKYAIKYNGRLLYCKKIPIYLFGNKSYAYLLINIEQKLTEYTKYMFKALSGNIDPDKIDQTLKYKGLFTLISSENIKTNDILPLYYARNDIEQFFDILKTDSGVTPIGVHSENEFKGHLLISCIAVTIATIVKNLLYGSSYGIIEVLNSFDRLQMKIFRDQTYLIREPTKTVNDVIKYLNIKLPSNSGALRPVNFQP